MRSHRIKLVACLAWIVCLVPAVQAQERSAATWIDISSTLVQKLTADGQKTGYPGETAGVAVDPTTGDVYLIVAGLGIYKSTDSGNTLSRVDSGKVGGRCETSFSLNFDNAGNRLACFMLDGKCAWTGDAGQTWNGFKDVGRNWDYAAVDWSVGEVKTIFAALHESGGQVMFSGDGGQTWNGFKDVGRNWDYAAVDWSAGEVKTIFAALHESGGQVMFSGDGGQTWTKLFKDAEFDKSGGLGVFDEKTLVYVQKGKGIQRSTDAGQTWTKTSDREPIGRLVTISKRKAYWLAKEGLLTSTDKGVTWTLQGTAVDSSIGPYFDPKNEKRIVVAGAKGIFRTEDAGENWQLVSKLPPGFDKLPKAGWFTNVAWDPVHDVFYTSHMGKPTYRLAGMK